ncbi:conserved repeat domain-containing protein/Listeria/Bacterioides repeat-containing protein [Anaerosphaera aminiphila DSM 21120]|uniref:Conserved repeat domain-containing protein/Listeria/Bacterioides repeat-containing protein n=1 Tax=Anaerosphaera aminiphila DSM 21120 TaxID=1120995 RepID=A0A1M5QF41_9FIRM|nr:S-layer homology domain-containing protein [Anaerosphaera aminiphila]SHH12652.1 conserved repeat domain-containing protein/Listeria/Bacterioides repeat-containing protein [Anaerosphaera aminiphila DSM 21120]
MNKNIKRLTSFILAFVIICSTFFPSNISYADKTQENEKQVINVEDAEEANNNLNNLENLDQEGSEEGMEEIGQEELNQVNLEKELRQEELRQEELEQIELEKYLEQFNSRRIEPTERIIKLNTDSNQKIDITEEIHNYLESMPKPRQKRSIPSDDNEGGLVTKIDIIVRATFEAVPGSKYQLSDYIEDIIPLHFEGIYVGDEPAGNITNGDNITDRINPEGFDINISDIYGNGGVEDKDLFTEDMTVDGYDHIADYLCTNFLLRCDKSVLKEVGGEKLDAYLAISTGGGGSVAIPELRLILREKAQPDGVLGDAVITKQVLNETKGETEYSEEIVANPGDKVSYKIEISNSANIDNPVTVKDKLNEKLTNIELVKDGLTEDDIFENKDGEINISTTVGSKENNPKVFIYKAVVAKDAVENIINIAEYEKLQQYKGELTDDNQDEVDLGEDGDSFIAKNGTEIFIYGGKPFVKVKDTVTATVKVKPLYKVEYDANGGTGSQTDTNSPYIIDSEVIVLDKGNMEKGNHTFTGWNTEKDGTGTAYAADSKFKISEDMTFYAQWIENDKYKVTYDGNGADSGAVNDLTEYYLNDEVTVKDKGDLVKANHTFAGWNTEKNGTGTAYAAGTKFNITKNITLYAQWTEIKPTDPKLVITKTDNLLSNKVEIGDTFKYYINIKNTGAIDVKNIKILDRVPSKLDIRNVVPSAAKITGQLVEYTVPTIKAGETFTITIEVKVNSSAKDGDKIQNIAVVDGEDVPSRELIVDEPSTSTGWTWSGGGSTTTTLNKEDHYAYMIGYPNGTVKPEGKITRAEVSTIFFRMMTDSSRNSNWSSINNYNDVGAETWYNNAISTLSNAKAVTGYPDGSFKPNAKITRGEFATMASRFLSDTSSLANNKFTDVKGNWAENEINKLASLGLISGYTDGSFKPDQEITRAEAATLVNAVLERTPDKDHLLSNMKTWTDNSNRNAWYYAQIQEATNSHTYTRASKTNIEIWKELLPVRDWAALEKARSSTNSVSGGGSVIK